MPSVITVIPARGGSKGIPKKNIALLGGKPLLAYTIEAAQEAHLDGPIVVSTDDNEITAVAKKLGVEVVKRPQEISGDTAPTEDALLHTLDEYQARGMSFDLVLTLQPTSPFRKPQTISAFVKQFCEMRSKYDAMLSFHEDRTDFWFQEDNGEFRRLFPDAPRRRQARRPLYGENSVLYITKVTALSETKSILGRRPAGFIIQHEEALDINDPCDLLLAEFLLSKSPSYGKN